MKPEIKFDFGTIAHKYDEYYDKPTGQMVDKLEKRALDRLLPEAKPPQTIFEVGSGTGHWSSYFTAKGYKVTGIDISPEMVEVARRKNIPGATFEIGDALSTGFPDNLFDVGVIITVLELLDDPGVAIKELIRVVKKDGRIIIGALNEDSYLGRKQMMDPDKAYSHEKFFTVSGLGELLGEYGPVTILQCLFAPPVPEGLDKAERIEKMGIERGWDHGNFLIAMLQL